MYLEKSFLQSYFTVLIRKIVIMIVLNTVELKTPYTSVKRHDALISDVAHGPFVND